MAFLLMKLSPELSTPKLTVPSPSFFFFKRHMAAEYLLAGEWLSPLEGHKPSVWELWGTRRLLGWPPHGHFSPISAQRCCGTPRPLSPQLWPSQGVSAALRIPWQQCWVTLSPTARAALSDWGWQDKQHQATIPFQLEKVPRLASLLLARRNKAIGIYLLF